MVLLVVYAAVLVSPKRSFIHGRSGAIEVIAAREGDNDLGYTNLQPLAEI